MYKLTNYNIILNLITGDQIPIDVNNPDYVKYLEWSVDGNIPADPDHISITPITEVKSAQAFHALALTPSGASTLYDDVVAWINTQPLTTQIDFNKRETFMITHPVIQAFKSVKGWTDSQLQELFTLANTL